MKAASASKVKEEAKMPEEPKVVAVPKPPSEKSPEKVAYHRTKEVGASVNKAFEEMNIIWGNIRATKREIKELEKRYAKLKAICEHVWSNPMADSD